MGERRHERTPAREDAGKGGHRQGRTPAWEDAGPCDTVLIFAFALFTGNRDYTGMWVRRGSTNLMAGKVVFLRGLLSAIRV
ncbi:hypothetical protein TNCV_33721 [Trichonephila clavipes]|nr:hypothetical protein TNCV_33721 [Trichonephila clavipes]